jgi:GH35 family endo-1,4-beta-xylanase
MKALVERCYLILVIGLWTACHASAQTTINGSALSHRSSGNGSGNWTLDQNGYVGTYITLAEAGPVTLTVNASGTTNDAVAPQMNLVIADTKASFNVANGFSNYQHTFDLPAGTYFVRTEFNNDLQATNRELTIGSVTVAGATVGNSTSGSTKNTLALAAADTYVENFRKGAANVSLGGIAPGTQVHVELKEHDFTFGTAVGGFNLSPPGSIWLEPTGNPNSDAYKLQQAIVENFNTIVPGNSGKWQQNEFTRDSLFHPVLTNTFNFASQNDLRMRMHNLIWGNQQPTWVNTLLTNAQSSNPATAAAAKADLRQEISERIAYYIGDGAGTDWSDNYQEVDILNEFAHVPVYVDIFGVEGIAEIYSEARAAVQATGNPVKLFTNEYNILQWSDDLETPAANDDPYANWYRRHVDELRESAGHVDGIGVQYYVDERTDAIGSNQHNAWRVMQVLQNLSVTGLDVALTEFGVDEGASEELAARFLDETVRLVFGNANSTGFTMWGFWEPDTFRPAAAFYDPAWNPRLPLFTWQDLMSEWDTDLLATVGEDGTIDFAGFFGTYEIDVAGQSFELDLAKGGGSLFSIVVAPGDYNADGVVDSVDYTVWRNALDSGDLRADGNGDRLVDESDYAVWKSAYGTAYSPAAGAQLANVVPEPTGIMPLATLAAMVIVRLRAGHRWAM